MDPYRYRCSHSSSYWPPPHYDAAAGAGGGAAAAAPLPGLQAAGGGVPPRVSDSAILINNHNLSSLALDPATGRLYVAGTNVLYQLDEFLRLKHLVETGSWE